MAMGGGGGFAGGLKDALYAKKNPGVNPATYDPRAAYNEAWKNLRGPQAAQGADYWRRISSYDPQASIEQYGKAAGAQANTYLTEALDRAGGAAVGAGRLDTGFFDTDQGDIIKSVQRDLDEKLAMQATNAAGLQLSQYGQMGNYAQGQQQQYYDLLSGELDRQTSERNARAAGKAAKGDMWGNIVGTGLKILPFLL